jgi:hypothetical protein
MMLPAFAGGRFFTENLLTVSPRFLVRSARPVFPVGFLWKSADILRRGAVNISFLLISLA